MREKRSSRREGGGGGGKETLRESKRSEKHETRISLSITYALNPRIYASGINARARLSPLDSPATSSRLKHVHAVRLCISASGFNAVQPSVVMAPNRYPTAVFERPGIFL